MCHNGTSVFTFGKGLVSQNSTYCLEGPGIGKEFVILGSGGDSGIHCLCQTV